MALVSPVEAVAGYGYTQSVDYTATTTTTYQQDIVIHRAYGEAWEEISGGLTVWHIYVGDLCQEDYGDIRFSAGHEGADLDYYLHPGYDSLSANFTVKLTGATSAGSLTIWYGASTAKTTTSNGPATYIYFEGFDAGATGGWSQSGASIFTAAAPGYDGSSYALQTSGYRPGSWGTTSWQAYKTLSFPAHATTISVALKSDYNGDYYDVDAAMQLDTTTLIGYSRASGWRTYSAQTTASGDHVLRLFGQAYWHNGYKTVYWDEITVRAYSATPPTATSISGVEPGSIAPVAEYVISPVAGPAPLTVRFTDESTNTPTAWFWDFGDGTNSTEQHPSHTYTAPGTYTVSLTASNAYGSDTESRSGPRVAGYGYGWELHDSIAPAARDLGAYGPVLISDGGYAWCEMTIPVAELIGTAFHPESQYWRVVRADASGNVTWVSPWWTRTWGALDAGLLSNLDIIEPQSHNPSIIETSDGCLLVADGQQQGTAYCSPPEGGNKIVYRLAPPNSVVYKLDATDGTIVWRQDISGYAIQDLAEQGGSYKALCAGQTAWYTKPLTTFQHADPAEKTHVLTLDASNGEITGAWSVHAEPNNMWSSSMPYAWSETTTAGTYWGVGWKATTYFNIADAVYGVEVFPEFSKMVLGSNTNSRLPYSGMGVMAILKAASPFRGYDYPRGVITSPFTVHSTSDGGAISTFETATGKYIGKIDSAGALQWVQQYASPLTGTTMPPIEAVPISGGYLALFQDGGYVRVSRLDTSGSVIDSCIIGDPSAVTNGKRLIAAPFEGYPYRCIITGSTAGFGVASGADALVVQIWEMEDLIYLGSGNIDLNRDEIFGGEGVNATVTLDAPNLGTYRYWVSVQNDAWEEVYAWNVTSASSDHHIDLTGAPAGNYTAILFAAYDAYDMEAVLDYDVVRVKDIGTVAWDNLEYSLGDLGYVFWTLTEPDYGSYSYWINISAPGGEVLNSTRLPETNSISHVFSTPDYGTYTAELYAVRRADGTKIVGDRANATLLGDVVLMGTVYNALTHDPLAGISVYVRQEGMDDAKWVMTAGNGSYRVPGLIAGHDAVVSTAAPGFQGYNQTIPILVSGDIYHDIYISPGTPSWLGIVGSAVFPPRNHPAAGYEIVLEGPENKTTTSAGDGYFRFRDIPNGVYKVYALNASGSRVSDIYEVALGLVSRSITISIIDAPLLPVVDFGGEPLYGDAPVLVRFTDESTGNPTAWSWSFGDGSTSTLQNPSHTYHYRGRYDVSLTVENWYGMRTAQKTAYISVFGTGGPSGGVQSSMPVRFVVQTASGARIEGVTVTATPLESSGPLGWLLDLFGIPGDVDINGTVLTGSTGSDGAIVLNMIPSVKYLVSFVSAAKGIDTEISVYPQEQDVVMTVWHDESRSAGTSAFKLYAEEIDGGSTVGVRYNSSGGLSSIVFTVKSEDGTVIHSETSTSHSGDISYDLIADEGVYIYGYIAQHSDGELKQDQYIRFRPEGRPLVDFATWIPLYIYNWAAIGIIVMFSMTFYRGEIRGAMLTIPLIACLFAFLGWLQVPWPLCLIALVVGVLLYMRASEADLSI